MQPFIIILSMPMLLMIVVLVLEYLQLIAVEHGGIQHQQLTFRL